MIRKKLQKIFKNFFQFIFKIVYGKVIYKENSLIDKNIEIHQLKNKKIKKYNNEEYSVYSIKNGRVYNDLVENVAIINKNIILDKISYQQKYGELVKSNLNVVLKKGTPRIKKKINSNLLVLSQGASGNDNYFHWLFDILPKIKICSEVYKLDQINNFYFSKLHDYQKFFLHTLGLGKINILDAKNYRHIEAEKIIAVDHPWYEKGYILEEVNNMPEWIIHWLRDVFLPVAEPFESNEKVFVDRSESKYNHCQIINNEEVSNFLKKKGFTKYKVGQLSFQNQVHLFKNAKIIVGAHGAAFANLTFCKPGTKVVEIKPLGHVNFVSKKISEYINLDYKLIEVEARQNNPNQLGDLYIDLNYLEKFV